MVEILSRPAASGNWASSAYANGRRERKVGAILHWMAGYLPGTTGMFQNPNTGYATSLGVGTADGRGNGLQVHRYVPADGYAYGSFNEYADRRGESIEIENDINLPYPGKPTPAVHDLVARLLAQLCVEEDWPLIGGKRQLVLGDFPDHRYYQSAIPGFGVEFNVTTHRSMALKDCPGSTDVQLIVDLGNQYLNNGFTPKEIPMGAKLYRNTENGSVIAADISTGFMWPVPNPDYLALVEGWNVFEGPRVELPSNIFDFVMGLAASGRAAQSGGIDQATLNALVTAIVNGVAAQLGDSLTDEQVTAIIAGVVAQVPKAINDDLGARIKNG